ncbi:HNH endonuclease domain-containing protein [Hymenobacter elongatus]|nr:HNH endonuclease domain-containing protein [Hymenobacter elongatus]
MSQLPESNAVNVAALSAVFADTTNSYKYYWFLAILDSLRDNSNPRISMHDLSLRMLASVWYPLDYFKLSFGSRDSFKPIANFVSQHLVVDNGPNAVPLLSQLSALPTTEQVKLQRLVKKLINWVPYRFIRPMFALEARGLHDPKVNALVIASANASTRAPYRFEGDSIVIHDLWLQYLQQHQAILRGFTCWHLVRFLQKNNPNVTGLTEKLEKPGLRDLAAANGFWKSYLHAHSELTCIYSGQLVTATNLSLDHFLPWSFVAHDQLWNIIPTPKSINSAKNNLLPSLERYFEPFAQLQFDAFQFHAAKGHSKLLEDYHLLFAKDLATIQKMAYSQFREEIHRQVVPRLQTAQNLGFTYPFEYNLASKVPSLSQ